MKAIILVGVLVGAVWFWGNSMPREHRSSSSITVVAPADSVYKLVRNIGNSTAWWSDVKTVRPIRGKKKESWEQDMKGTGPVQVEVTSYVDGQRLITTILNDDQQDWGGKWIYTVASTAAGTEVTIVEEGWVASPFFRVVMKLRGGPHKTLDSYLRSLAAHFGETVTPRHDTAG
jgi:uncharacterized protein YndB with AHSA1/START domain